MTSTAISGTPTKPVLLFAAHALVLALLIGFWPSARDLYPGLFRAGVAALLERGNPPSVAVRPGSLRESETTDTFVEGIDPDRAEPSWRLSFSTIRMGYWPSAVLFALLFATPMSARRRTLSLMAALLWIGAYAGLRLSLDVVRAQVELARGGAGAAAEGAVLYLRTASEVLGSNILEIAVVLLAWVVLANPQRVLRLGALGSLLGVQRGRSGPNA